MSQAGEALLPARVASTCLPYFKCLSTVLISSSEQDSGLLVAGTAGLYRPMAQVGWADWLMGGWVGSVQVPRVTRGRRKMGWLGGWQRGGKVGHKTSCPEGNPDGLAWSPGGQ